MKALEIKGQRFGRLVVLYRVMSASTQHTKWLCKCDCGTEKIIYGIALRKGSTKSCGCLFKELRGERSRRFVKDLIGVKFDRLTVVSRNLEYQAIKKSNSAYWNCICECGGTKIVSGSSLRSKYTPIRSCGCLRREMAIVRNKNKALPSGEAGFNEILTHYKYNAKKKGRTFELSKEDFRCLTEGNCYYCNSPPSNILKNSTGNFTYNGIDRLNNDLGYELSNCVSCCYICNKAKMEMHTEDFKTLIKNIYENLRLCQS